MNAAAIIIIAIAASGVLMMRFRKRWLAKINIAFTNRITSRYAARLPGFGILTHVGRKSGKVYRTPVNVFRAPEGRMAWEIKVDDPKSQGSEIHYFDAETYFLLRFGKSGSSVTYSDYRDVGGIKLPFMTTREFANSRLVATVRELKINAPIDDARFSVPQPKGGVVAMNPVSSPKKDDADVSSMASPNTSATPNAEISSSASPKTPAAPYAVSVTEVNFPNFTSCPIAELQLTVPELNGLKPARDQEKLAGRRPQPKLSCG